MSINNKKTEDSSKMDKPKQPVTVRSIIISLIFVTIFVSYNLWAFLTAYAPSFSTSMFPNDSALIGVVLLLIIGRFLGKIGFSRTELGVIYSINALAQVVVVVGVYLTIGNIASLIRLSLENPRVFNIFLDKFPDWLFLKDTQAGMAFWIGGTMSVPWGLWIKPIIVWTVFWLMVLGVMLSLAIIVRRDWIQRQHLPYPLVTPVVQLIDAGTGVSNGPFSFDNKFFMFGIIVPIIITGTGIINAIFPVIPAIPTVIDMAEHFTEEPWSYLALWPGFTANFSPLLIGIAYLVSAQASFSMWLGFLIFKFGFVVTALLYGNPHPWANVGPTASRGMFIGIALFILWLSKDFIKESIMKGLGLKKGNGEDKEEAMSYKGVFWTGILCFIGVSLFCIYLLNAPPIVYLYYFTTLILISFSFARLRAETGYAHALPPIMGTYNEVARGFGNLYPGHVSFYSMIVAFSPMSTICLGGGLSIMLEAYKMGESTNAKRRSVTWALIVSLVYMIVLGFIITLVLSYRHGGFNLAYFYNYHSVFNVVQYSETVRNSLMHFTSIGVGMVLGLILMYGQAHYIWWPLLPLGIAVGASAGAVNLWASFLVAWFVKVVVTRYGGTDIALKLRETAIGLIFGSLAMSVLSVLVNLIIAVL